MFTTISVIIPVKPGDEDPRALEYLEAADYPDESIEIIVVSGNNPPLQRNKAARMAKGEILYFFNADVQVPPDIFRKVTKIFNSRQGIAGIGGPDLTPAGNNRLQHLFGLAMASFFAHWKMRARYLQLGRERLSDERELLLSNTAIRRDVFLKFEGFNGKLYPNEENELINRMCKAGHRFVYSPELKIYRDRRATLGGFLRQFFRYGQGRASQIFIEGARGNLQFLMPLFLLTYLFILPLIKGLAVSFGPLFMYLLLGVADAIYCGCQNKNIFAPALPFLYMMMHISYAAGMCSRIILSGRKIRPLQSEEEMSVTVKKPIGQSPEPAPSWARNS